MFTEKLRANLSGVQLTAVSNAGKHFDHGEAVSGGDGECRTLLCTRGEVAHAALPRGLIFPQWRGKGGGGCCWWAGVLNVVP